MDLILYYCHACGTRLSDAEVAVSLNRGEMHFTVCCAKCAQCGKRIADPEAAEAAALSAQPAHFADSALEDEVESIPEKLPAPPPRQRTPASGIKINPARPPTRRSGTIVLPETARKSDSPTARIERPQPKSERTTGQPAKPDVRHSKISPVLVGGIVFGVLLVSVAVFALSGGKQNSATWQGRTDGPAPAQGRATVPQDSKTVPVNPAIVDTPAAATTTSVLLVPALPNSGSAPASALDDYISQADVVESYMRQKGFSRALEKLQTLQKIIPKDENFAVVRARIEKLKSEMQSGSKKLLDDVLKTSESKANSGDTVALTNLLRLYSNDLLPEHAAVLEQQMGPFRELAKASEEKKLAELAKLLAEFEASLPSELPPPSAKTVLFGPASAATISLRSGGESLRQPVQRLPFLDGTKAVLLVSSTGLGMVSAGNEVILEYSAISDFELVLNVIGSEKTLGGSVTLPAGKMMKKSIAIDNKTPSKDGLKLNFKGHWAGRGFNQIKLDFKNMKPGKLALFRVSI